LLDRPRILSVLCALEQRRGAVPTLCGRPPNRYPATDLCRSPGDLMLAPMILEPRFVDWNRRWGAPFGLTGQPVDHTRFGGILNEAAATEIARFGLFSAQPNNSTRQFEYPWAYYQAQLERPMKVLEIGGGLSGFQFVLNREGHAVDNVDPGMDVFGFEINKASVDTLNRAFGTTVTVHCSEIERTDLAAGAYDRAFSLSVLEHLSVDTIAAVMTRVYDALKPGGLFVLTVDLFLDVVPFRKREANQWGRNVSIATLFDPSKFELIHGRRDELYGFGEFEASRVLANAKDYFIGRNYPTLIQTLVLRRA
jgi:SAM-dependent methyltransferase